MTFRHTRATLARAVIDVHNHVGVSINAYARQEYPYAATAEGLYYRQKACGVDVSVLFPFTADLFFDMAAFRRFRMKPARQPLSPSPYAVENELLLREVVDFCPELTPRFLPFVSVDPARRVRAQIRRLETLAARYPIYGVKVSGVLCQSPLTAFHDDGRPLMNLIRRRNWPVLLHTSCSMADRFSNHEQALGLAEAFPEIRFCLAHCIGFHRPALDRAAALPNVWIDTSALVIQVMATRQNHPIGAPRPIRFKADFRDPAAVLRALAEAYPDRMVWGSDTPAYSYICRRRQGGSTIAEFRLKSTYDAEVNALRALPRGMQRNLATRNTLDFLFGRQAAG